MNGESERMNRVLIYHNSKIRKGVIINVEEIQSIIYTPIDSESLEAKIYGKEGKLIAIIDLKDIQDLANLVTLLGIKDYEYIYIEDGEVKKWTGTLKEAKEEKKEPGEAQ